VVGFDKMDFIQETVLRIVGKAVGSELPIELDSVLSDMRVNSIKIIQIIAMLETELEFELEEEDLIMSHFLTPRQIVKLLRENTAW
jgi:acyl carrier protein